MEIIKLQKDSFTVIGKEGSTKDGIDFVQKLWSEANQHFHDIKELAKMGEDGLLMGIWGAMSDMSHSFKPWENDFTEGLYLAGIECKDDAIAPEVWTKWIIPGYEYICVENESSATFDSVLMYMRENQLELAGAVHDFNDPRTGKGYMFFPIKEL